MAARMFKVIVVGGGPVGLTAAHALEKAGIDFTLLESRPHVVIDAGSNLVLNPMGLSILSQLGMHDALFAASSSLGRIDRLNHKGSNIGDMQIFIEIEKKMGTAPRAVSRHDLTKVLYDALSPASQSKIQSNKKLADIEKTADRVVAKCSDGSSYHGDIIVGADGAHSIVRRLMRKIALKDGSADLNEEQPFLTTYRALWVRFPRARDLPEGTACEAHGHKLATQLFAGEETAVIGVYEPLEAPTKERQRYTEADQQALVERWGHIPVVPSGKQTLRDVFDARLEAGLVSLEEGVVEHWSHAGRVVLVGDSAHKYTPSTGMGCNSGIEDVLALVNELKSRVDSSKASATGAPSAEEVATAFHAYQAKRYASVQANCKASGQATAVATWHNAIYKFVDRFVISSHTLQRTLIRSGGAAMPEFNFLGRNEQLAGRVPCPAAA